MDISNFTSDRQDAHTTKSMEVDAASRVDGSTKIPRGTVMGKVTATGKYVPYDDGAADGSEVAAGILGQGVDVKDGDVIGSLFFHGTVDENRLTGLDAAAKVDLGMFITFTDD
jgi:hypothetical protein